MDTTAPTADHRRRHAPWSIANEDAMPGSKDYYWNANDSDAAMAAGAAANFATASLVSDDDGYGGTNWTFASQELTIHVHCQGTSRRVSVVRIKTYNGGEIDDNIIKLRNAANKGVNLKGLARYCDGFPNHKALLERLHEAFQE
jgi:hypothetical protein